MRHPCIAANAAGKVGEARVELVDVAVSPARDLPIRADAELLQHSLEHRPDADDQLEIIRCSGTIEQQWRRIVFKIDQKLTIARGFVARIRDRTQQRTPVLGELTHLPIFGRLIGDFAAHSRAFRFAIARFTKNAGTIGDDNPDRQDDEREEREAVHDVRGSIRVKIARGVAVLCG